MSLHITFILNLFHLFGFSSFAVWDMVSQVSMLYMLLSLCMGWTLSRGRKPQSRPLQWEQSPASTAVAVGGVVTQACIYIFIKSCNTRPHNRRWPLPFSGSAASVGAVFRVRESSQLPCPAEPSWSPAHGLESGPGPPAGFCPLPDHLYREEHSKKRLLPHLHQGKLHCSLKQLQRDGCLPTAPQLIIRFFLQGCFLWFLCHPVLVLMSVIFNEHQREKVWTF